MTTRREVLLGMASAGGLVALDARPGAGERPHLITRSIPSTGERLPIIGLGSSATFAQVAQSASGRAADGVAADGRPRGAGVDTAPAYGASEEVAGRIAQELGIAKGLFWATKPDVAGWGRGSADPDAARKQLETSFQRIGKAVIDLVQVQQLGDVRTQLAILRQYKEKGRIPYIGVTTTIASQYDAAGDAQRTHRLHRHRLRHRRAPCRGDHPADRGAEGHRRPRLRFRAYAAVAAREGARGAGLGARIQCVAWPQFFLKYVAGHPAVTAITPATSRRQHGRRRARNRVGCRMLR